MKRTYVFVSSHGSVKTEIDGRLVELPIFMGVLKHPTEDQLRELLRDPRNARKYTREALRKLPWNALRQFPKDWLQLCLTDAVLPQGRRRALEHMLSA